MEGIEDEKCVRPLEINMEILLFLLCYRRNNKFENSRTSCSYHNWTSPNCMACVVSR